MNGRVAAFGVLLAVAIVPTGTVARSLAAPVCEPQVRVEGSGLRLRPHRDALLECTVEESRYRDLVDRALSAWASPEAPVSVGLGRIVHLPWLSSALANAAMVHPLWNGATGRPVRGHINRLVASLLMGEALAARLSAPLRRHGYALAGVSVEKVLVDRVALGAASHLAPVDAQVWLRLSPRPEGTR